MIHATRGAAGNSVGENLNRCYDDPDPEDHEGAWVRSQRRRAPLGWVVS